MKVVLKKKEDKKKLYALGALGVIAAYTRFIRQYRRVPISRRLRQAPPSRTAPVADTATAAPVQRRGITSRGSAEFQTASRFKTPGRPHRSEQDRSYACGSIFSRKSRASRSKAVRGIYSSSAPLPRSLPQITKPIPKVQQDPDYGSANATSRARSTSDLLQHPSAPPIPLKYYGFTNTKGEPRKKAFFLDGEDIIVAWEGETVKSRYKVVRVGVNSIEMEDTQFKSKQTLPLEPEPVG